MKRSFQPLLLFLPLLLLAACVPAAADGRTGVVVINAPAEDRVAGLAEGLQERLGREPGSESYRFAFPASVRFQETHRDMFGTRAPRQASLMARNLGASYAVMVSAPVYRREVERLEAPSQSRLVLTAVTLEVSLVDPAGEVVFRTRAGGTAVRVESVRPPLVAEADDPDLRRLKERALAEMAPETAARLAALVGPAAPTAAVAERLE